MMKKLSLCLIMFCAICSFAQGQSEATTDGDKKEMNVLGDPGEGLFFIYYNLPKDAKKVIWTVTDENGKVLIKEKYKNLKAGKNKIQYNYLHGPDGLHTFKIVADETFVLTKEVLKQKK